MLTLAVTTALLAWHQPASRVPRACATAHGVRAIGMKSAGPPPAAEARALSPFSIVEFEDNKGHTLLGLVQSSRTSGAKGILYEMVDAQERLHTVPAKAIHVAFPPNLKVKSTKPADHLKDFLPLVDAKPLDLGIDVSLLGLAWEVCAEEDVAAHTTASIFDKIDPSLLSDSIAQYKAYRLLASDIGSLFFKVLHAHDHEHREYKAKTADAVAMSKASWCQAVGALGNAQTEELCFV